MSKSTPNRAGRKARRRHHVRPGDLPTPYARAAVASDDPIGYLHDLLRRLCEMRAEVKAMTLDPDDAEFPPPRYMDALDLAIGEAISHVLTVHANLAVWLYDNGERYPFASGVGAADQTPPRQRGEQAASNPTAYLLDLVRRWCELHNELHYVRLPDAFTRGCEDIHQIQRCIHAANTATFDLMNNYLLWYHIESQAAERASGAPQKTEVRHG